jgi:hypothetical protein
MGTELRRISPYLLDVRKIVGAGTTAYLALGHTQRVGKVGSDAVLSVTAQCGSVVYDVALSAGLRMDFSHLTLAAAMNHAILPVYRRPRIAILATGSNAARATVFFLPKTLA